MHTNHFAVSSACAIALAILSVARGAVPTYRVDPIAAYSTTTTIRSASEAGHVVGDQVINGQILAFVAKLGQGLIHLPLPAGYISSTAMGVNSSGVIVGAVADSGFPFDVGEPAIWTPNGSGGYDVTIPQQFESLPSPLGTLTIRGGMAVAINEGGTIVGWSRYSGFQGGPSTIFSLADPPVNLSALGFTATVTSLNNNNVAAGGQLRFDLNTNTATDIGVPPPLAGVTSFTNSLIYSINDSSETAVAADLASIHIENYLSYLHNDADGFIQVNPAEFPARFVGFYDNNNLGDFSGSGGVLFRQEGVLVANYDNLLASAFSNWNPGTGFIGNDRRVYAKAINNDTGDNALVVMTPIGEGVGCSPADLNDAQALTPANPKFGVPDGVISPTDFLAFRQFVITANLRADLSSEEGLWTNLPGFGIPDGKLSRADLNAFVYFYNAGCD